MAYAIWLRPAVHTARSRLPGNVRHRIARLIDGLADEPRPPRSRVLTYPEQLPVHGWELRRARMDDWRVIYAVNDAMSQVAVLDVRRRPPYDYDDLDALMADL